MSSTHSELSLNAQQQVVAQHRKGPLLVLAGAGSGKTASIVTRAAQMVHEEGPQLGQADPERAGDPEDPWVTQVSHVHPKKEPPEGSSEVVQE
ncbi:UvrD-helicase domain-containing protein [Marinospirillum sp. MEB164]|uniref:UvrD-helicase domain-containing protein n=1 Tax=Marinospirillum alkalitolerans TaxID=3123374 RepID=A0ABW8PUY4_9GAMM